MYKVEVLADNSGEWAGNGIRFNTREEAEVYGLDLSCRWTAVREYRVVETAEIWLKPHDPANPQNS